MADQSKAKLQKTISADQKLTEHSSDIASTTQDADQGLSDDDDIPRYKKNLAYSSVSIPSSLTGKQSTMMSKMIVLSDSDHNNPILAAEIHIGYSWKVPLGFTPGVVLYDGTSKRNRVIAAAGYKSLFDSKIYSFSIKSDIWLPRLIPKDRYTELTAETMRAHTLADGGVAFTFSIPIEIPRNGKFPRETFEWRKTEKCEGDNESIGGFNLLWLRAASQQGTNLGNRGESSSGTQNLQVADDEATVASMSYAEESHD